MEQQELDAWRDFCEGRKSFGPMSFSNMFMGMFAEQLGKKDRDDLRTVFSYIPNSSQTLEKLFRIGGPAVNRSQQEIAELVVRDLKEMRPIIDDPQVLAAMALGVREIVVDETRFRQVFETSLNRQFINGLSHYHGQIVSGCDAKIWELDEAFYGIACDLHLQFALTADLVGGGINFGNYFELYLVGANYALDSNGALVIFNETNR